MVEYTEERMNVSPTQQQERDQNLRHAARGSRKIEIDIKCKIKFQSISFCFLLTLFILYSVEGCLDSPENRAQ